ncbi:PAS-domain containing protein [Sphingomonas sp. HHU CXW]|jgi:hypothetical protein|uniref:PAS-domain containing protein n=1 Tax=Sphingomonas hominis TaxID=2741495 RepID=A0ABX2JCB6_9SPHN|nr:PAS-domain containing protein [Sphingomonas hominis]NTS63800.1 PAS-domain containing protein [Sphingomonas hominis]
MTPTAQIELVMANMRHGMVMYDRHETIRLINAHVSQIFGFAETLVTAGSSLADYLRCVGATVGWSLERTTHVIDNHRSWRQQGVPKRFDHHFDDGKTFEITFNPVDNGASVLTFVDVTDARDLERVSERRVRLTTQAGTMLQRVASISAHNRIVALNASIEAARMGSEGRSFAVVADEVRNLSNQMSEVLSDLRQIIDASLATS